MSSADKTEVLGLIGCELIVLMKTYVEEEILMKGVIVHHKVTT